jgi:diguanylate cyclase (GGDEF)-like protein
MMETQSNTLLLASDDPEHVKQISEILADMNCLEVVRTGAQTIESIQKSIPLLLLLDAELPDMAGLEVIKLLKLAPSTEPLPVVMLSEAGSDEAEEQAFLSGAADFIRRPYKPAIVKARIQTQLRIVHQNRRNAQLSFMDPLTEVPNRRCFSERIEMEWRRAIRERKPISFLMMDLDNFKHYNDTYGHPQGDTMLKAVSAILMGVAKRASDLVARLGGEEFGMLLPELTLPAACQVAEHSRKLVESTIVPTISGEETHMTLSIGVVSSMPTSHEQTEIDAFIAQADKLLYMAKGAGKNRICSNIENSKPES